MLGDHDEMTVISTINGLVRIRRMQSGAVHLADVRPEAFIPTQWIGPPYWALHWSATALCGAVLKPDGRGLVAMQDGTKVTCRHCCRAAHLDSSSEGVDHG